MVGRISCPDVSGSVDEMPDPHAVQNRAPSRREAPHFGQFIFSILPVRMPVAWTGSQIIWYVLYHMGGESLTGYANRISGYNGVGSLMETGMRI